MLTREEFFKKVDTYAEAKSSFEWNRQIADDEYTEAAKEWLDKTTNELLTMYDEFIEELRKWKKS